MTDAQRMKKSRERRRIIAQVERRNGKIFEHDVIARTEDGVLWAWDFNKGWTRL